MQRYFASIVGKDVLLSEDDVFHLTRVMRARSGDEIEVVCDKKAFLCVVKSLKPLSIKVKSLIEEKRELNNKVILIAALIKGEKMDLVIQKATELGVNEIVLLETERTVVKTKGHDMDKKLDRFRKIAKEASEQSHRTIIPDIYRVIDIKCLSMIEADIKVIPYELKVGTTKSFTDEVAKLKKNQTIAVVIGPEGGFAEYEVKLAKHEGYVPVSLGRRILRAETASIYALSIISCMLERK